MMPQTSVSAFVADTGPLLVDGYNYLIGGHSTTAPPLDLAAGMLDSAA